jgi:hypothetical protein
MADIENIEFYEGMNDVEQLKDSYYLMIGNTDNRKPERITLKRFKEFIGSGSTDKILSSNPSSFNIAAGTTGEQSAIITSTVSGQAATWSAASSQDWCVLTAASGTNGSTLKFKLNENSTHTSRSAVITITQSGGQIITITIQQEAKAYVNIESVDFQITDGLFNKYIGVQETAIKTVLPQNASNQAAVWTSSNESIAKINVTTGVVNWLSAGAVSITCTSIDNSSIKKTKEYQVIAATDFRASQYAVANDSAGIALNKKVTITSYRYDEFLDFEFSDLPSWLTITKEIIGSNKELDVIFVAEAGDNNRNAIVTATQASTGASLIFTVTMAGDTFTFNFVDPNEEIYDGDAREIIVQVKSTNNSGNIGYTFKSIAGGFLQFYTIDADNNIRFRMSELINNDPEMQMQRFDTIELVQNTSGKKITKTIRQNSKVGDPNEFSTELTSLTFNYNDTQTTNSQKVKVTSKINSDPAWWSVTSKPDWIAFVNFSDNGTGGSEMKIYCSSINNTNAIRTGTIVLTQENTGKTTSMTVSQNINSVNFVFTINPTSANIPATSSAQGGGQGLQISVASTLNGSTQRWYAETSNSWLSFTGGGYNNAAYIYWDANTAGSSRTGTITFKQVGADDETVVNTQILTITQA